MKYRTQQQWLEAFSRSTTVVEVERLMRQLAYTNGKTPEGMMRSFHTALDTIMRQKGFTEEQAVKMAVEALVIGNLFRVSEGQHR